MSSESSDAVRAPAHILIVDDDPSVAVALKELLEYHGYRVEMATNGHTALTAIETAHPDLILSDITMPVMDGYQFFDAVRARPDWLDIPFIFLTGRGDKPDVRLGKRLGADDYVVKPFDKDDLLASIESKLRRRAELESLGRERARILKRTILNTLTHEFRTPLSALSGYINLLEDSQGDDQPRPDEMRRFMRGMRRGSERLSRLVEDFLLLVELETGEARADFESRRRRVTDLATLVSDLILARRETASARNVTLTLALPRELPPVLADPVLLMDALGRLVNNAIKFSKPEGGTVTVGAAADAAHVRLWVRDEGLGIAEPDLDKLFDVFSQINRAKQEQQGSGSGLAIVQGIAKLHGGKVLVDSEPGVGSRFTLELPVTQS